MSSTTNEKETSSLDRQHTPGGHVDDRSQPPLPVVHRSFANPAPLGLIAFATNMFLICVYGLNARGIQNPNIMVGMLVFFGGICQVFAGLMEFLTGNTFGSTVFCSYGAFNLSYGMIYLPGTGIMTAYTDPASGAPTPEFNQAISIFMWVWLIVSVIFTVAAVRSTWILFLDMFMVDLTLLLLACGFMVGTQSLLTAGYSFGLVVTFLSYWAGCSGLWSSVTQIKLPTFEMSSPV